jgi:hypothetical protein
MRRCSARKLRADTATMATRSSASTVERTERIYCSAQSAATNGSGKRRRDSEDKLRSAEMGRVNQISSTPSSSRSIRLCRLQWSGYFGFDRNAGDQYSTRDRHQASRRNLLELWQAI